MANDSLAHHLLFPFAAGCPDVDDDEDDAGPASVAFPAFWPPFPPLSSDSDSDIPSSFAPPRMDRREPFFGLGFHDVDEDEWAPPDEGGGEVELPLCWDCLQLEDHHDDHHQRWDVGVSDADEWEQVAGREEEEAAAAAAASAVRGLEWEVLLATNSLGSHAVDDDLDGGIDTYFLDEAYDDVLFGQLATEAADHEPPGKGGRPAAKAAVEGLPTVVVAEADAARGDAMCAVCKDGVEAGERARRLPCAHLYHEGCILPWLAIRNTCPLCRHELPTDDPEYEKWKARRAAGVGDDAELRGAAAGYPSNILGLSSSCNAIRFGFMAAVRGLRMQPAQAQFSRASVAWKQGFSAHGSRAPPSSRGSAKNGIDTGTDPSLYLLELFTYP